MEASYEIIEGRAATKYRMRLPRDLRRRFEEKYEAIRTDPFQFDGLRGDLKGYRCAQVGGYRIVYEVDTASQRVYVLKIHTRGQVYHH